MGLICRDTVEERVAELQERKRARAEAIVGGERAALQGLSAADLAFLLE
jgi:SNF2 family DNA or RNA helicase